MTTLAPATTAATAPPARSGRDRAGTGAAGVRRPIPLRRIVAVEARKSFDTRSGFWLLASIGISALLATAAVLLWAPARELTFDSFAAAIGVPMSILLPIVAILVGDQRVEPAQRAHDVHPGAAPRPGDAGQGHRRGRHRRRLDAVAFAIGAVGNIIGTRGRGRPDRSGTTACRRWPTSCWPTSSGCSSASCSAW